MRPLARANVERRRAAAAVINRLGLLSLDRDRKQHQEPKNLSATIGRQPPQKSSASTWTALTRCARPCEPPLLRTHSSSAVGVAAATACGTYRQTRAAPAALLLTWLHTKPHTRRPGALPDYTGRLVAPRACCTLRRHYPPLKLRSALINVAKSDVIHRSGSSAGLPCCGAGC
jgi:hypothetical protein